MFEHIRLRQIGSFSDGCEFLDLSRINVICGKNNSGKTTLLNSINDPTNRRLGITATEERLSVIIQASIEGVRSRGGKPSPMSENNFTHAMRSVFQSQRVWFSGDEEKFHEYWNNRSRSPDSLTFENQSYDQTAIVEALARMVAGSATVIIPPKRVVELEKPVRTGASVDPSGVGLLNRLFTLKNQVDVSPARRFYDGLSEAFVEISNGYRFDVTIGRNPNDLTLLFQSPSGRWVPTADCGLGLQDLLVILFFARSSDYPIILLEEPETHMHPEMQRRLLRYLKMETRKQYFVTTHSNVFLDGTFTDRVLFTQFNDRIKVDDATRRAMVLSDLGYAVADNLSCDVVILVEGPTDVPVLEELLLKVGTYGTYDVKIWPLGGDVMDQLDLSVFLQGPTVFALIDKDPKSSKIRARFMKKCEELDIPVTRLQRYAIENYFPIDIYKTVFKNQISNDVTMIEPSRKVSDQIGLDPKKNNRRLAKATALSYLEGTDLLDFPKTVDDACRRGTKRV